MRLQSSTSVLLLWVCSSLSLVSAWNLTELCTKSFIELCLPSDPAPGVVFNTSTLSNACNVTIRYNHAGLGASVWVGYILPDPTDFKNRYISSGGGGLMITGSASQGLPYGAAGGQTDGRFGLFSESWDTSGEDLLANGTLNYESLFLFSHQAHAELSLIGKALTRNVYEMANDTKRYAYYSGCSEGGREGWSQIQRYGDEWDGAVVGAPAFRRAHQQTLHVFSAVVEKTLDYVPPPCAVVAISNLTVDACDALDGRTDGVLSRTDLCQLNFNLSSLIGTSYDCAATTSLPEQNGTITQAGIDVVQTIHNGVYDSAGNQAYLSWTIGTTLGDAESSAYNTTSDTWELPGTGIGAQYVMRLLKLLQAESFPTLECITYDTLVGWMYQGMQKYNDTLQTTWPELTPFNNAGGKVIHYHGESDGSIPAGSSVHYYESVAKIMYPSMSYNESHEALGDWYRLFLVPGAGHCDANSQQPNGPFPQAPIVDIINWVENGVKPVQLNATVTTAGEYYGDQPLCAWPLRPRWNSAGTMECEYDQASIDTWQHSFPAFKIPVY